MDNTQNAELGRKSVKDCTFEQHLRHLIAIGWNKEDLLIRKYITKNNLTLPVDYEEIVAMRGGPQ